jgi:erythromycin esterase
MCAYNQAAAGSEGVGFAGFDMQSPDTAMDSVIAYFEQVEPSYSRSATIGYSCLRLGRLGDYAGRPTERRNSCRGRLQEVYEYLVSGREEYVQLSSEDEYVLAEQSARLVLQAEDCLADFDTCDRDRYMAENVDWLLERAGPDARIILWAHNDHVARRAGPLGRSMGSYLDGSYGDDMIVLGFAMGDEGSFNAITFEQPFGRLGGLDVHLVPSAPRDSYEWFLERARLPRLMLDLRDLPQEVGAEWLNGPRGFRSIGAVYDPDRSAAAYFVPIDLASEFDLLIYVEETTPSHLLSLAMLH